jgi:ABC-type branched-subunit amino acid transport system substrate-binding protein
MPWVFCVAPGDRTSGAHALGYDAAAVTLARIRSGVHSRRGLRDALATGDWHEGMTGTFRFDPLGRRLDPAVYRGQAEGETQR